MTEKIPPLIKGDMVLRQIYTNVYRRKMNQIILVNGLPRTGKSELCLKVAEALDPQFTVDNIAWKYKDLLKLEKDSNRTGEVLMWDEAGIAEWGANARQFWSEGNLSASTLFQTMGFKRNIVLVNLPMKIMLDKHVRSLIHVMIKTLGIDYRRHACRSKVYFMEPSEYVPEGKSKFPRFNWYGGRYKVKSKMWGRASKELRDAYVERSEGIKQQLQEKLIQESMLREMEKDTKARRSDFKELYNEIVGDLSEYWDYKKNKANSGLIQLKYDIGQNLAQKLASTINLAYDKGDISL